MDEHEIPSLQPDGYQDALARPIPHTAYPTTQSLYAACPLPADGNWIRLLDLEPSGLISRKSPLRGRLRAVCLDDKPRFFALSYVWGSTAADTHSSNQVLISSTPRGGDTVTVPLGITANCHEALTVMRKRRSVLTIWVDAICINQDKSAGLKERSSQVPLMETIYTFAERVLVYLGPGNRQTKRDMRRFRLATHDALSPFTFLSISLLLRQPSSLRRDLKLALALLRYHLDVFIRYWQSGFGFLTLPSWSSDISIWTRLGLSLEEMEERPWFHRVWTFQEVVLANCATLYLGDETLEWQRFMVIAYVLRSKSVFRSENMFRCDQSTESKSYLDTILSYEQRGRNSVYQLAQLWMMLCRPEPWFPSANWLLPSGMSLQELFRSSYTCWIDHALLELYLRYIVPFAVPGLCIILPCVLTPVFILHKPLLLIMAFQIAMCLTVTTVAFGDMLPKFDVLIYGDDGIRGTINHVLGNRKVTEPKDLSYAMYGVLKRLGAELSPPDYNKPDSVVFSELLVDLVRWRHGLLDLIIRAQQGARQTGPTWSRNWEQSDCHEWVEAFRSTARILVYHELPDGVADINPWVRELIEQFPKTSLDRHSFTMSASEIRLSAKIHGKVSAYAAILPRGQIPPPCMEHRFVLKHGSVSANLEAWSAVRTSNENTDRVPGLDLRWGERCGPCYALAAHVYTFTALIATVRSRMDHVSVLYKVMCLIRVPEFTLEELDSCGTATHSLQSLLVNEIPRHTRHYIELNDPKHYYNTKFRRWLGILDSVIQGIRDASLCPGEGDDDDDYNEDEENDEETDSVDRILGRIHQLPIEDFLILEEEMWKWNEHLQGKTLFVTDTGCVGFVDGELAPNEEYFAAYIPGISVPLLLFGHGRSRDSPELREYGVFGPTLFTGAAVAVGSDGGTVGDSPSNVQSDGCGCDYSHSYSSGVEETVVLV